MIFDTSVISALSRISLLDKIIAYKEATNVELMLPSEVYNELKRYRSFSEIEKHLKQGFKIITPLDEVVEDVKKRKLGLGPGEISVIATAISVAKEDNEATVITIIDDKRGRRSAKDFGLEIHGSLWMIIQLKRHRVITKEEAISAIKALPQHGFHASEEDLQTAIEEAQKDC